MDTRTNITWHISSHSVGQGNCVEAGWHVSSYSASQGNCVEVAESPVEVLVRDTKDRSGGTLHVPAAAWTHLLTAVSH